jgi:hypothetical protein
MVDINPDKTSIEFTNSETQESLHINKEFPMLDFTEVYSILLIFLVVQIEVETCPHFSLRLKRETQKCI